MTEQLLTTEQVAERLQISVRHVHRLATGQHRLTFIRVGNKLRFRASDIDAWIDSKLVQASSR